MFYLPISCHHNLIWLLFHYRFRSAFFVCWQKLNVCAYLLLLIRNITILILITWQIVIQILLLLLILPYCTSWLAKSICFGKSLLLINNLILKHHSSCFVLLRICGGLIVVHGCVGESSLLTLALLVVISSIHHLRRRSVSQCRNILSHLWTLSWGSLSICTIDHLLCNQMNVSASCPWFRHVSVGVISEFGGCYMLDGIILSALDFLTCVRQTTIQLIKQIQVILKHLLIWSMLINTAPCSIVYFRFGVLLSKNALYLVK